MTGAAGTYGFDPALLERHREGASSYDKNGNIQSLIRKGKDGNELGDYSYIYEPNTNRLDKVDHNGAQLVDYTYNSIGQMIQQNEGTSKTFNVTYNAYGLVKEVRDYNDQPLHTYFYDDRGGLLRKISNINGVIKYITYVNDVAGNPLAIYVEDETTLSSQPSEVPVYGAGRVAVYKPAVNTYFYEVSDHLGNVRAVIGVAETETFQANFEAASNGAFQNYSRHDDDLMDHTDTGETYIYSHLLNGGYNGKIGLAKSLDVSPGDIIKVEAYAKYRNLTTTNVNLNSFASYLTGAFGLTSGAPGDPGLAYDALEDYGSIIAAGYDHSDSINAPKAYLNILLFDKNFNFVDAAYRQISESAEQAGTSVKAPHDYLMREVTVLEPGYAYIFFSNENLKQVDVHFDDVTITHTHSNIVAGGDYYPFGLAMENREITDEPYRYGYQGQFSEKDLTTGMQEFELRMYDPRIGRWLSPDPYGQYASPYMAMGNTPHRSVDPDGGFSIGCPPACVTFIEGVGYMGAEFIAVSASRISLNALPVMASVVGRNMAGGQVFTGTDDGLYSVVPKITGTQYFQAIDDQWKLIRDDGIEQEKYARALSETHNMIADGFAHTIGGIIGGFEVSMFETYATKPLLSVAAKGAVQYSDDLVRAAQQTYPKLAGKTQLHHITPKYLGGVKNVPLVPLDGAYHQMITNEFRALWGYGKGVSSATELQSIMKQVYSKYPLPPGYGF